ncbi:MAG: hypothetical protein ISN28_14405 [Ectothiorhodospiraceae bacterium AqS1]|nr:hypothetical protein [Ectothiorhodospiraceae bacterium AqS1]
MPAGRCRRITGTSARLPPAHLTKGCAGAADWGLGMVVAVRASAAALMQGMAIAFVAASRARN